MDNLEKHLPHKLSSSQIPSVSSERLMLQLDDIEGTDLPLTGGKAFRLARLRQHGVDVPPGLVLTTKFFESQIHATRLTPLWAGSPDIAVTAEALEWLADALKTRPLIKELAQPLRDHVEAVFGPEVASFAVRSSVVDEDQRDHTFAGIHLSELAVPRGALDIAITRCWASALSKPAIEYRQGHGMSIQKIRIAVLIQPMLTPDVSGVAFTVNPLTGAREEIIVEATWGLGNLVVSGDVQPYFYRLLTRPPAFSVIEQHYGSDPRPTDQAQKLNQPPLSEAQLMLLARQLEQVQAIMGEAQDVEWAHQEERFIILQTRPIAVRPEKQPARNLEWTQGSITQAGPELPAPFFGSLLEHAQPAITSFFAELGLQVEQVAPLEKLILGRPYFNVSFLKSILAQMGVSSRSLLRFVGDADAALSTPLFSLDWKTVVKAHAVFQTLGRRVRRVTQDAEAVQSLVSETVDSLTATEPDPQKLSAPIRQQILTYSKLHTIQLQLDIGIVAVTGLGGRLIAPVAEAPITEMIALAVAKLPQAEKLPLARRWLLKPLVRKLQEYLLLRDDLKRTQRELMAAIRRWGFTVGEMWATEGWLSEPGDIFWLTVNELEQISTVGPEASFTLGSTVKARQETYKTYEQTTVPLTLKDSDVASIQLGSSITLASEGAMDVIVGSPISPGQARGRIVVVRHPDRFLNLDEDVILVMASTDPARLALLRDAAGLIVETGGLLSHGSVIAREYGLPAVANIPNATRRFHTGDKVLVDGSTGVVQVLESSQFTTTP